MKCPKCNSELKTLVHQNVEVDRCPGCGGIWFDAFENEELRELSGSEKIDYSPKTTVPANSDLVCAQGISSAFSAWLLLGNRTSPLNRVASATGSSLMLGSSKTSVKRHLERGFVQSLAWRGPRSLRANNSFKPRPLRGSA